MRKIIWKTLNEMEKQLNDAFNSLKDMLNEDDYWEYGKALETITVKLSGKQFDNAFNYFINRFNWECIYGDNYAFLLYEIAQRLNERQMNIELNYLMDKLNDKNEHQNIRIKCIKILERISNKCEDEKNRKLYAKSIGYLSMKLNKKQLDDVFERLNGLKDESECICALCGQSLETMSTKLNDKQLDRVFSACIHGLKESMES
ncbi:hypothetical protein RFI_30045 [Reticulomyxa filosa]|uniref:Uncharacterized protein n=1 Tax=Reticulomyxa filosa TaxID=46433 RepID=X6M164_RETFI|nr:hypothetical protein RFI_30045 [Reticulomyxa filosa]|eukprot:ETO07346.1 hypothetical protein RFI_30045 [Reticulomyxa filosa]